MAKTDYVKHYKLFEKYDGSLRKYCESRRPALEYDPTKSAFKRIKKRVAEGSPITSRKDPAKTPKKPQKDPKKSLTRKQNAFAKAFPKTLNGTKAAKDAKYSIKCARQIAVVNMKNPDILKVIDDELLAREKRTLITQDMVVNELANIALARYEDVATWDENGKQKMIPTEDMNERGRATMKSIKHREIPTEFGEATEFEFSIHDKKSALVELMKHTAIPFHIVETIEEVTEKYELDTLQQIQLFETLGYRVPRHLELEATRQKSDEENFDILGELDNDAFEEKLIERKKNEIIATREAQLKIRMKELDELNAEEKVNPEEVENVDQD